MKKNYLIVVFFMLIFSFVNLIYAAVLPSVADTFYCSSEPQAVTNCELGGDGDYHTLTDANMDNVTNMIYQYNYTFSQGFGYGIIVYTIFVPSNAKSNIPAYLKCLNTTGDLVVINSTLVNGGVSSNYILGGAIPPSCQLSNNKLSLSFTWDPTDHPDAVNLRDFFFYEKEGAGAFVGSGEARLNTSSGEVQLIIPQNALSTNEFITISGGNSTPTTNISSFMLQTNTTPASLIYSFGPEGLNFNTPITITIKYNDSLIAVLESTIKIYFFNATSGQWEAQNAVCDAVANTCSLNVTHFSDYILGGSADSDGDGIIDANDACPLENANNLDADKNGCKDTIEALINVTNNLNLKQGISNSLDAKLQNAKDALNAVNAGNRQDAISKLASYKNEVEAQRNKAITNEQANLLIAMVDNIIAQIS